MYQLNESEGNVVDIATRPWTERPGIRIVAKKNSVQNLPKFFWEPFQPHIQWVPGFVLGEKMAEA